MWTAGFGVSIGDPVPLNVHFHLDRGDWGARISSGYWHSQWHTWWTGTRFDLHHSWCKGRYHSLETGISGTYYFAQAVDSMAIAVNQALGSNVMYDAQWEEWYGVGPCVSVKLWFLFIQATIPLWQGGDFHRDLEWRLGLEF